jgi:outer membrane protein TolC
MISRLFCVPVSRSRLLGVSLLAFCVTCVSYAFGETADSIVLPAAINLAIKSSATLNAAGKGLTAAKARTSQAKGAWFPSVNGVVSYANLGPVEKMNLPLAMGIGTNPVTGKDFLEMANIPFQLFPENNWDLHVGADYLIYDFGRREKAIALSAFGEQGQQIGADFAAKRIAYITIIAFESLLSENEIISAKRENITNLSQHLDFVKKKLSTGSSTQFDVLRSEVQLTNSQTELTNLLNDQDKQQIDFRQLLGLDEAAATRCVGAFDSTYREPPKDSLVEASLKQRTEIDMLNLAIKATQVQLSLARTELTPELGAHVAAGAKNGYIPNLDQLEFNWVAGAQITAPIFDGRRSHFHVKELESRIDSLKTVLEDLQRHVRTDVLKAISDVKSAHQNVSAAAENVRLASESRRIATLQYEAGVIPNLDLLDAEDKYTQAKFSQVQSEFRYTLSKFALMQVTGFDFAKWADAGGSKN